MKWIVNFHKKFEEEFDELQSEVQDELLAHALLLEQFGSQLGAAILGRRLFSYFSVFSQHQFLKKPDIWNRFFKNIYFYSVFESSFFQFCLFKY